MPASRFVGLREDKKSRAIVTGRNPTLSFFLLTAFNPDESTSWHYSTTTKAASARTTAA